MRLPKYLTDLRSLMDTEHIIRLLQNPRASPNEVAILFGILGVGILIVLVLMRLLIVSGSQHSSIGARLQGKARGRGWKHVVIFFEALAILTLFYLIAFSVATSLPRMCQNCHAMKPSYISWQKSDHKTFRCGLCHQRPGILGFFSDKLKSGRMIVNYLRRSYREPIKTAIEDESCFACHHAIESRVVSRYSVKVSHKEFLAAGFGCMECHGGVGHKRGKGLVGKPTMDKCILCHDGRKAANRCSFCHLGNKTKRPRMAIADFPRVWVSKRDCEGCHSTTKCTQCHGIYMPHPVGFNTGKSHARLAFTNKSLCWRCHETGDCLRCHSQVGTHGPKWVAQHGITATPQTCNMCHHQNNVAHTKDAAPSAYFCDNCHAKVPPPRGPFSAESPEED